MDMTTDNSNVVRILWTGGWDSTFQLLRVLFIDKKQVVPYYLKDENRASTSKEIKTMEKIRAKIYEVDRRMVSLLLPTETLFVSEIPEFVEITSAVNEIREMTVLGRQYDWLARFCEHMKISNLQLCIHEDDKAAEALRDIVINDPKRKDHFKVSDLNSSTHEYTVFHYFTFPIFNLTKLEMENIAKEHRWMDIMGTTWFCHNPKNGKPCGRCSPCFYTVDEGLGWRIPRGRLVTGHVQRFAIRPLKSAIKKALMKLAKTV